MEEPVVQEIDPLPEGVPWYRGSTEFRPFVLSKVLSSNQASFPPFHCTATFPWSASSIHMLWDGHVIDENAVAQWQKTVDQYAGSVAVGSTGMMYLFPKLATAKPLCIRLYDDSWEVRAVAWAINLNRPVDPLVIFAPSSIIYILDVKTRRIVGQLRGHGGPITSIAVHPVWPYLFCTTSRDFTTRIYDLTYTPMQRPNNPPWPPSTKPSLAGPAFGLQMTESEGDGMGQCVAVLVGGRSGGHRGAVFCAAFHSTKPIIATGGMDRAVKIWSIPPLKGGHLAREDKPLFSTDYIHKARVLSISWLGGDILISHSAPAPMRFTEDPGDITIENGTVQVWQWLGFNRFFPPDRENKAPPKVMRGCASDYRNSESFKVLSAYHLPLTALHVRVYTSPTNTHDPLLLVPVGRTIRAFNITQFEPRPPPPFPYAEDEVVELTKRMRLDPEANPEEPSPEEDRGQGGSGEGEGGGEEQEADFREDQPPAAEGDQEAQAQDDEEEESDDEAEEDGGGGIPWDHHREGYERPGHSRYRELFAEVKGWDIDLSAFDQEKRATMPDITTCEVASDGRVIVGAGDKGTVYVWRLAGSEPA